MSELVEYCVPSKWNSQLAEAVCSSLSQRGQKELPYTYLYDELGSVLFEAITLLPEYGVSRAEARLLHNHAHAIARHLSSPLAVAELGSGTGTKTRTLLEAVCRSHKSVCYYPIDVSSYALDACAQTLGDLPGVSIVRLNHSYLEGLEAAVSQRGSSALLVLFLGSTIGNLQPLEADSMLLNIRKHLRAGDAFLMGADLEKDIRTMLLAYDDPLGVTAAFNLNLLGNLNRSLGADFDLSAFAHEARYNQDHHRIEMHLRSMKSQTVTIRACNLSVTLREDETIWTESSYKYKPIDLLELARRSGFEPVEQWIDEEWPFALSLWSVDH
jgi:dimethylhistidine N-methyltransferase